MLCPIAAMMKAKAGTTMTTAMPRITSRAEANQPVSLGISVNFHTPQPLTDEEFSHDEYKESIGKNLMDLCRLYRQNRESMVKTTKWRASG